MTVSSTKTVHAQAHLGVAGCIRCRSASAALQRVRCLDCMRNPACDAQLVVLPVRAQNRDRAKRAPAYEVVPWGRSIPNCPRSSLARLSAEPAGIRMRQESCRARSGGTGGR